MKPVDWIIIAAIIGLIAFVVFRVTRPAPPVSGTVPAVKPADAPFYSSPYVGAQNGCIRRANGNCAMSACGLDSFRACKMAKSKTKQFAGSTLSSNPKYVEEVQLCQKSISSPCSGLSGLKDICPGHKLCFSQPDDGFAITM